MTTPAPGYKDEVKARDMYGDPSTGFAGTLNGFFNGLLQTGGQAVGLLNTLENAKLQRDIVKLQAQSEAELTRAQNSVNVTETPAGAFNLTFWQKAFVGSLGFVALLALIALFRK